MRQRLRLENTNIATVIIQMRFYVAEMPPKYSDKITDRYYEYFKISSNIELKVLLNTRLVTKATRPPCIAVPVCAGVPIRSCRVPPCSVLTCFVCRRRVPSHRERCRRSFGC